jgi:integrase
MLAATSNNLRGVRDRALILLAYDSLCRRNELVCLKIEDIHVTSENNLKKMKIRLRKSKTDQELIGKWIIPSNETIDAIAIWINKSKIKEGYLLRGINNSIDITCELKCNQINRIYKRLAKDAKFPKEVIENISGH